MVSDYNIVVCNAYTSCSCKNIVNKDTKIVALVKWSRTQIWQGPCDRDDALWQYLPELFDVSRSSSSFIPPIPMLRADRRFADVQQCWGPEAHF